MASPFFSKIVNRPGVVVKCGRCKNRTTNASGFCHLHENDARVELDSQKKAGKLADATLVLTNGKTPLTQPEDHKIVEERKISNYTKELEADLTNAMLLKHPIFLHGAPGVGKSAFIENFAKKFDAPLEVVIGGQMTPTDVAGLPYSLGEVTNEDGTKERGGTATDTPEWGKRLMRRCKDGRPGVLFFDELTNTDRQTQAAMLRLINERIFPNGDRLPDSVAIFAAGNVGDDAVVTEGLGAAMKNRFTIRECHPPVGDFVEGLSMAWGREDVSESEKQARMLVAAYLTRNPDAAYDEKGLKSEDDKEAFATYRSWDKLSESLGRGEFISEEHVRSMFKSYIGTVHGDDFYYYVRDLDLPDPKEVVKDPKSVDWNNITPDKAFAIMLSISQGAVSEEDPIGTLKLYTHVAKSKSQQFAASTLGGLPRKVRDAWLRKGNGGKGWNISDSASYRTDPTYEDYRKSFKEFSESFKDQLDAAGLSKTIG